MIFKVILFIVWLFIVLFIVDLIGMLIICAIRVIYQKWCEKHRYDDQ